GTTEEPSAPPGAPDSGRAGAGGGRRHGVREPGRPRAHRGAGRRRQGHWPRRAHDPGDSDGRQGRLGEGRQAGERGDCGL
ncbi:MAG: KH domain RNA binding protein YlqC, partial [uncultured Rubrobacteraceae bacterium]